VVSRKERKRKEKKSGIPFRFLQEKHVDRRCTCTDSSLVRQMQNVSRRDVGSGSKQVVERLTIPLFFVFFFVSI